MAERERQGSAHSFEVVIERDVMVTMRDGVRLATDITGPHAKARRCPATFRCCWSARRMTRVLRASP